MTYSTDQDVKNILGALAPRLPEWVVVADFRDTANAETLDALAGPYPNGFPDFSGPGLAVVRLAEARLAAAAILEAIRINLPDLGDAPDQLRAAALATLSNGVPGYPAGSGEDPDSDPTTPPVNAGSGPRASSWTPLSAFPDPYEAGRVGARFE